MPYLREQTPCASLVHPFNVKARLHCTIHAHPGRAGNHNRGKLHSRRQNVYTPRASSLPAYTTPLRGRGVEIESDVMFHRNVQAHRNVGVASGEGWRASRFLEGFGGKMPSAPSRDDAGLASDVGPRCSCFVLLQRSQLHPPLPACHVCRNLQPITPRAPHALQPAEHPSAGVQMGTRTALLVCASAPRPKHEAHRSARASFACPTRTHGRKGTTCLGAGANACHLQRPKLSPLSHMHGSTLVAGGWRRPIFPSAPALVDVICQKAQEPGNRSARTCARRETQARASFVTVRARTTFAAIYARSQRAIHTSVTRYCTVLPFLTCPHLCLPCGPVPRRGISSRHPHFTPFSRFYDTYVIVISLACGSRRARQRHSNHLIHAGPFRPLKLMGGSRCEMTTLGAQKPPM